MATEKDKQQALQRPELETEVASRDRDPYEQDYLGIIRPNDVTLLEKGGPDGYHVYRDLMRDPKVFSDMQKRKHALLRHPWNIKCQEEGAAGEQAAETLSTIMDMFAFDQACRDLLDALLMGFAVSEVIWTIRDSLVVPARLAKRAQRRFRFVQEDKDRPPELRLVTRENMLQGERLPERKFVVHRVNPEDDNPYGTGLGQQLYWPVFFKRKGILYWAKFCERFGSPTPWGKYPKGADKKSKDTLFAALRAMSNDGVVMTPEGMSIELLQAAASGSITTQADLVRFMDDQIGAVILGQDAKSESGGALAAASKERADVREDLVQADSDLLSETLNSGMIAWICWYNGLPPCLLYREVKQEEDKKAAAETDQIIHEMGFVPSLSYIRSRYGEHWEEAGTPAGTPAEFAEPGGVSDQDALDAAVEQLDAQALNDAAGAMLQAVLGAIEAADSYEDALTALEQAFPKMDTKALQGLLAQAMFGAETFGRLST